MKTHVFLLLSIQNPFTKIEVNFWHKSRLTIVSCHCRNATFEGKSAAKSCLAALSGSFEEGIWACGNWGRARHRFIAPLPLSPNQPPPLLSPNPQHPSCDHLDIKYHRPCETKSKNHVTCFDQQVLCVHHKWNVSSMASSIHKCLHFFCHYTKENI